MSFRVDLVAFLKAQTALTAVIGTKLFPRYAIKPPYPHVTYFKVDNSPEYTLKSVSGNAHVLYQFDIWAKDDQQAGDIADILETIFNNFKRGRLNGPTSTFVQAVFVLSSSDEYDDPEAGQQVGVYHDIVQAMFHYVK